MPTFGGDMSRQGVRSTSRAKPGYAAAGKLLDIVKQRSEQYEGFDVDARRTADLCNRLFGITLSCKEVCRVMLCMKLGRIPRLGSPTRDTLLDLAGYACILADLEGMAESEDG